MYMSWDLLIFKSKSGTARREESLGSLAHMQNAINRQLPSVEWLTEDEGEYLRGSLLMTFKLTSQGDKNCIFVSVRGSGKPVEILAALCIANGWQIFDTTLGATWDLANPSEDGWNSFQEFCGRATSELREEEPDSDDEQLSDS
jgi:hypothetical protein